ncbi:MAG: bifunctional pyr operon transcriptional regulator/uracil phosphoribosyltransferase PyrR [Clostridium sp.]|nr:bifunctional pyr operon transcriptional regulator/uracil phosphoribosyltransferase PyrR [Clostridium sp.]MCM1547827.1 bifunctional pyr operon transcriptional regulator/uracil phosphoribosyltransferase PyrR [Ruminococcus sp.]
MCRKTVIMDENAMKRAFARITYEILERNKGADNLCLVGIYSRGVALAERIAAKINELENVKIPCGGLDITAFRDDMKPVGECDRTNIDFDIRDKNVVIVDDVLYTGRSTRAAIDALIERGRPRTIQLAVLIDRGHRELPIRPDYVGKNLPTSRDEKIKVSVTEIDGQDIVSIYTG